MFIVYIVMNICRFLGQVGKGSSLWGPSWSEGPSLLGAEMSSYHAVDQNVRECELVCVLLFTFSKKVA